MPITYRVMAGIVAAALLALSGYGLGVRFGAAAGYRSNSTARTPLLKLHVSQLKLKPDAAQHSSKSARPR